MEKPEEFKKEFISYLETYGFKLMPWQYDVINRMTQDFAMVTQQLMTPAHTHSISLDICKKPCPVAPTWPGEPMPKEGKKPMASYAQATVINPASIEAEQRETVRSALSTAKYTKANALEKQFGLTDDEAPKTPAEFIERITSGQYTVDEKYKDDRTYAPANYIRWRDPNKVEDKAGYKDAIKKLDEAYADAKLKAALLPISDLLKLVEDFKAFKA